MLCYLNSCVLQSVKIASFDDNFFCFFRRSKCLDNRGLYRGKGLNFDEWILREIEFKINFKDFYFNLCVCRLDDFELTGLLYDLCLERFMILSFNLCCKIIVLCLDCVLDICKYFSPRLDRIIFVFFNNFS